jgi:DNA ligase (NAD+)
MIDKCPICETGLIKKEGMVDSFCPNENCPARNIEGLIHFASRDAMNLEGFGERIIEDFYNYGYIKTFKDFYNLKDKKEELKNLEGFGEKSINNLFESIENSKSKSLERLIFALGISGIGLKTAKVISKKFTTLNNIMNATEEDFVKIKDIGQTLANNIVNYFKDEENMNEVKELVKLGINDKYIPKSEKIDVNFNNKLFVITGSFENFTRNELKELIEIKGGSTSESVSGKTDVVIVGEDPGSKYDKAIKLKINIWNKDDVEHYFK